MNVDVDWAAVETDLDTQGCAIAKGVLTRAECDEIAALIAAGFCTRRPEQCSPAIPRTDPANPELP